MKPAIPWLLVIATLLVTGGPLEAQRDAPVSPGFVSEISIENVPWSTIFSHLQDLEYESLKWLTDEQHLVFRVVDQLRVGPRATVRPRLNTHLLGPNDADRGLAIGQIESSAPVPSMGISNGVTHVWYDDRSDTGPRVVMLPHQQAPPAFLPTCRVDRMPHPDGVTVDAAHAYWDLIDGPPPVLSSVYRGHYQVDGICIIVFDCVGIPFRGGL